MNWLDLVLIVILAASIASSFARGFTRELIGLLAAAVGLICGAWFYRMAGALVRPYVGSTGVANLCGFLLIFATAILIGWARPSESRAG
jgi:membrane protein required for colicin V production